MKKKGFYAILAALTVFALAMTGCPTDDGGGTKPPSTTVTITYNLNGGPGSAPQAVNIKKNGSLSAAQLPTLPADIKNGKIWTFEGWYKEAAGTNEVTTATTFASSVSIFAKWDDTNDAPAEGKVAVIFNFNWPASVPTGTPPVATIVEITHDTTIDTSLVSVQPTQKPAEWEFSKWSKTNTGSQSTDDVTASTNVGNPDPPILNVYAIWVPIRTITYNLNGATAGSPPTAGKGIDGAKITLATLPAGVTGPARREFIGWSEKQYSDYAGAATGQYTIDGDAILYAVWAKLAWPGAAANDTTYVEEISLSNGWFAIYKFNTGTTKWSELTGLKVDYKVADITKVDVRARVFGNYVQSELDNAVLGTFTPDVGGEPVNIAVVATWPRGDTGSWILDNTWAGNAATKLADLFPSDKTDPVPVNNTWFTVTYGKPGSNPHAQQNNGNNAPDSANAGVDYWRYKDGRRPVNDATGTFYLGVGISSTTADSITTSQIRNVKLISSSTEISGTPLYFTKDSKYYRAFAGQLEKDDKSGKYTNTNGGKPDWDLVSGGSKVTDTIAFTEPADITITYNANVTTGFTLVGTAPEELKLRPGSRITVSGNVDQLPALTATNTTPTSPAISLFQGWFTAPTDGIKVIDRYQFDANATLYAQWKDVANPIYITYNNGGGAGSIAPLATEAGATLTAAQLGKGTLTGPTGKGTFGGWYKVDTTAQGFNPETFTNLVTTDTTFSANTTIYAYWYAPPASIVVNDITVLAAWGARIDAAGYVIFANGANNGYLGANGNDTLLNLKLPDNFDATGKTKCNITYLFKWIIEPPMGGTPPSNSSNVATTWDDWKADAAGVWKKYNTSNNGGATGGPYFSFNQAGGTLVHNNLDNFKVNADDTAYTGISIQVNGGDDNNPANAGDDGKLSKRAGGVYGIKITAITFE